MSDLVLLRPYWLLCLLPLMGLAYWAARWRTVRGWSAVIDPELLTKLRQMGLVSDGQGHRDVWLPFVAAGIVTLGLAGPAIQRPGSIEMRALDPLILVLDLSPSVVADPRVLGTLQSTAAEVLALVEGRPIGMMVYAADAYLASAPTTDAMSLQGLIAVIEQNTVPVAGSRPDIALSMARDLFGKTEFGVGGADFVVISDGGGTGPRATEEAARLASDGARVWALTLTENAKGAPPPTLPNLEELAMAGGGAALPISEVPQLMDRIASARTAHLVRDDSVARVMQDYGPWLLPLALMLLFPLFRRRR